MTSLYDEAVYDALYGCFLVALWLCLAAAFSVLCVMTWDGYRANRAERQKRTTHQPRSHVRRVPKEHQ